MPRWPNPGCDCVSIQMLPLLSVGGHLPRPTTLVTGPVIIPVAYRLSFQPTLDVMRVPALIKL